MRVSVVIPVYNGAETISELAERLEASLGSICVDYEVIMVNDGSEDESWTEIKRLCQKYSWIIGMDLMKNYGQHNALLCGIRTAEYEYTITMDDDLQHPPEEIPKLLSKLKEGFDVVYGIDPVMNRSVFRYWGSRLMKFLVSRATKDSSIESMSAFRLFKTAIRRSFESYSGETVCLDALLTWGARRCGSVEVVMAPRSRGISNYGSFRLIAHAVNNFSAFHAFPLKIMSLVGMLFALVGMFALGYILINYAIHGAAVPGFTFLGSAIALFSGVQLLFLCVMGEYVSRIHSSLTKAPPYSIHSLAQRRK